MGDVAPIHSFVAVIALPIMVLSAVLLFVLGLPAFSLVSNVALRTDTKVLHAIAAAGAAEQVRRVVQSAESTTTLCRTSDSAAPACRFSS